MPKGPPKGRNIDAGRKHTIAVAARDSSSSLPVGRVEVGGCGAIKSRDGTIIWLHKRHHEKKRFKKKDRNMTHGSRVGKAIETILN